MSENTDGNKLILGFFNDIQNIIKTIKPGERIKYPLPVDKLNNELYNDYDWDTIEGIQTDIRGYSLPDDIFSTIRFDKDITFITVDFYRLPEQ
jgi:hypothetical protein